VVIKIMIEGRLGLCAWEDGWMFGFWFEVEVGAFSA